MTASDPFRVGVSGCGGITPWTFAELARNAELFDVVAVHDPDPSARRAIGERFGVGAQHVSFEALLAEPLDLLILNGPNDVHRGQVERAATRGIPCLVQKPLAQSVADARAMVAAAQRADLALGVVMMERSHPIHHAVRDLVRRGFLGQATVLESVLAHDHYLRTPPPDDNWRRDPARVGGGAFAQLAVHAIDLAVWITGEPVTEVAALASSGRTVFSDETTVAAVRLGEHACATFTASWAVRAQRFALHGTDGTIVLDPDAVTLRGTFAVDGPVLRYAAPGRVLRIPRAQLEPAVERERAALEVHARFARSLRGQADNPCTGAEALAAVRVIDAVQRSVASGGSTRPDAS